MQRFLRLAKPYTTMTRSPPKNPLIAIIGATGTGKSQLAVHLAQRYNGEIINGDAMQLYAGLPVITNKISTDEQAGIRHHLLGCIGLHEQTWAVGTFVKRALSVIEEIRARGKLPILVGGTHYYTQSLLFHDRLVESNAEGAEQQDDTQEFVEDMSERWPVLREDTPALLEELKRVDPVMADRWHPNDRRKIQRSLEIFLQTGKRASEVYATQRERLQSNPFNTATLEEERPSLRFPTLIFWTHAETPALRPRLDKRVDKMFDQGLLDEVQTLNAFAAREASQDRPVDESRGIWVSIGYKEFKAYAHALTIGNTTPKELEMVKNEALERTKIATRQYAKRQVRWIRIKLVNALVQVNAEGRNLYLLDASDAESFAQNVELPALQLTQEFLTGSPMPAPGTLSDAAAELLRPKREYDLSAAPDKWAKNVCEVCGVTCVTQEQWEMHLKSKAHRKLVSKAKKVEDGNAVVRPGDEGG